MSRIIKPMGSTVARITITFDEKGQAAVEGRQVLQVGNKTIREEHMSPLEVAARLSGVAYSTLAGLLMAQQGLKGGADNGAEKDSNNAGS